MAQTELKVSNKNLKLRIAAFAAAFVVAIAAFANGVLSIGRREPGWYAVEKEPFEDAQYYGSGMDLYLYLDGSSAEIRTKLNEHKSLWSNLLHTGYLLLDSENTHDGIVGLADINAARNQKTAVSKQLYDILAEADSFDKDVFDPCAGQLYAFYDSFLYLEEPGEVDPVIDSWQAEKEKALQDAVGRKLAHLEFEQQGDEYAVTLVVEKEYEELAARYDFEGPILDLGPLKDAYRIRLVHQELEKDGALNGYLASQSGITLTLAGFETGSFAFYAADEEDVNAFRIPAQAGQAYSFVRTFGQQEYGFYTVNADGIVYRRHPYPTPEGWNQTLLSLCALAEDPVQAALQTLGLLADHAEKADCACILSAQPHTVYVSGLTMDELAEGYVLKDSNE